MSASAPSVVAVARGELCQRGSSGPKRVRSGQLAVACASRVNIALIRAEFQHIASNINRLGARSKCHRVSPVFVGSTRKKKKERKKLEDCEVASLLTWQPSVWFCCPTADSSKSPQAIVGNAVRQGKASLRRSEDAYSAHASGESVRDAREAYLVEWCRGAPRTRPPDCCSSAPTGCPAEREICQRPRSRASSVMKLVIKGFSALYLYVYIYTPLCSTQLSSPVGPLAWGRRHQRLSCLFASWSTGLRPRD